MLQHQLLQCLTVMLMILLFHWKNKLRKRKIKSKKMNKCYKKSILLKLTLKALRNFTNNFTTNEKNRQIR